MVIPPQLAGVHVCNSRSAKQQQRQGRKMEPVQLTNDLQNLVDQNIISKEQAKNMMKDTHNTNSNTNSIDRNNANNANFNTAINDSRTIESGSDNKNANDATRHLSSSMTLDDKINSLLSGGSGPTATTGDTTAAATTTMAQKTSMTTDSKLAPVRVIKPANEFSSVNTNMETNVVTKKELNISSKTHLKRPSPPTSSSDSLTIQTNTSSMDLSREKELQILLNDGKKENNRSRTESTGKIMYLQTKATKLQRQRPSSTGHEDSEKKHTYPNHRQTKSELPGFSSNNTTNDFSIAYDEIISSMQKQKQNTDDNLPFNNFKSTTTDSRNSNSSSGRNSKSPNMQHGSNKSSKPTHERQSSSPSRNAAASKLLVKKERDIEIVKGVFLCSGVEKSWISRRLQRAFDQWIMYANHLRNRELSDRITVSRKQEEELHGASLRKITQEFVRVSEKISNFDRMEKHLRHQNRSLNTTVSTLREKMAKMEEDNKLLKDKLGNTKKNLEQIIASQRETAYSTVNNDGNIRGRRNDDVLVNSVIDVMEDSLRVLDIEKNKSNRNKVGNINDTMQSSSVKNRNNKRPRIRSPINSNSSSYEQPQQWNNNLSRNSRKEQEEVEENNVMEKPNSAHGGSDKIGITMEELETIQMKMQNHCRKNNVLISRVFTENEKKFGKDIGAFVETLDAIGLSLNILEGFELVGILKILDSKNDGIVNVNQFVQFLTMESDGGSNNFAVGHNGDNGSYQNNDYENGVGYSSVVQNGDKMANRGDNSEAPRQKQQHVLLDRSIYNTRKSQIINDYFYKNRRAFFNLYKNFANTNSSTPWIDFDRWMDFSKSCGLVTGNLSRRQVETLFEQSSEGTMRGRINFQTFLQLLVGCATTMTGPYQYVEERLAFLFKRFGECGHNIPNGNMVLTRVLQTKAVETSPWNTPMLSGNADRNNLIESMEDKLGSPAMEYDAMPFQQQQQQHSSSFNNTDRHGGSNVYNMKSPSFVAYDTASSSSRSHNSPLFDKAPIEELGVRDISNLKAKLNAVAKVSSSSTFRKFLMAHPSPSLSYTRFTRLIRESLRKNGYPFSGNEAAYLLRAVDPQGDGIIFGKRLKQFLGIVVSPRQPQWGSPSGQISNTNNKSGSSNRNMYSTKNSNENSGVGKHTLQTRPLQHSSRVSRQRQQQQRGDRRYNHTNSRQVMENNKKINDIRMLLEQTLGGNKQ
eukprot:g277.t1